MSGGSHTVIIVLTHAPECYVMLMGGNSPYCVSLVFGLWFYQIDYRSLGVPTGALTNVYACNDDNHTITL